MSESASRYQVVLPELATEESASSAVLSQSSSVLALSQTSVAAGLMAELVSSQSVASAT